MNALAIHLYLTIRHINLSFNYFGNFYRIIVIISVYVSANIQQFHQTNSLLQYIKDGHTIHRMNWCARYMNKLFVKTSLGKYQHLQSIADDIDAKISSTEPLPCIGRYIPSAT